MNRRERRRLAKQRARRKNSIAIAVLAIAMVVLVGSLYLYFSDSQTASAALAYGPEDVVYDQPLHVIHEMGEGPPIPFLPKDQAQPSIVISEKSYNFGSIGPTDVVQRSFAIHNTGDATLTISRAYTTCGCTTAEITASSIPPGKVAEVTLTFDAGYHDTAGQTVRRGLIIENNDPHNSQAEFWTEASVRNG
jgi:hypothetical protein